VAKILIAPDSFKGSATSAQVAKALADGWKIMRPDDEIVIAPFADGGEGTLDCIESVTSGSVRIPITVQGATSIEHESSWLLVGSDIAVIEMATLCGITTLDELDPVGAHSYGLGQAIKAALDDERVNEILVAVGGSASTDAGMGALSALGFKGLDSSGEEITRGGGELHRLVRIETQESAPKVGEPLLAQEAQTEIGVVTSVSCSRENQFQVLALVKKMFAKEGEKFRFSSSPEKIDVIVQIAP
jgi:glycerate kinase